MTEVTQVQDRAETPIAQAQMLSNRMNELAAALKFGSVYEYLVVGPKAALATTKPVLPHTWAGAKVLDSSAGAKLRAGIPSVSNFPLAQNDGTKYNIDIPIGVTVILGKSGSGKTRFAFDHLFTSAQVTGRNPLYVKMHEPGDEDRMLAIAARGNLVIPDFEVFLANTLATELFSYRRDFIVIDSLRYLFYSSSGGATGKGGVNMSLFMDLTHLDVLATRLKQRVLVVINPMTDDPSAFDFYVEAAVGAVSGVIVMDSPTSARQTNRYAPTRDFIGFNVPGRSANDKSTGPKRTEKDIGVGGTRSGNVAVSSAIFGRNK